MKQRTRIYYSEEQKALMWELCCQIIFEKQQQNIQN